ncbi:MAG: hypothetical protein GF335_01980, partial [Candidatus Moranbacteria bacterium]|nr:hypothetical protein [Candidatus Moranbacteria bacterium]
MNKIIFTLLIFSGLLLIANNARALTYEVYTAVDYQTGEDVSQKCDQQQLFTDDQGEVLASCSEGFFPYQNEFLDDYVCTQCFTSTGTLSLDKFEYQPGDEVKVNLGDVLMSGYTTESANLKIYIEDQQVLETQIQAIDSQFNFEKLFGMESLSTVYEFSAPQECGTHNVKFRIEAELNQKEILAGIDSQGQEIYEAAGTANVVKHGTLSYEIPQDNCDPVCHSGVCGSVARDYGSQEQFPGDIGYNSLAYAFCEDGTPPDPYPNMGLDETETSWTCKATEGEGDCSDSQCTATRNDVLEPSPEIIGEQLACNPDSEDWVNDFNIMEAEERAMEMGCINENSELVPGQMHYINAENEMTMPAPIYGTEQLIWYCVDQNGQLDEICPLYFPIEPGLEPGCNPQKDDWLDLSIEAAEDNAQQIGCIDQDGNKTGGQTSTQIPPGEPDIQRL